MPPHASAAGRRRNERPTTLETLAALSWTADAGKYFSFREFFPHLQDIEQQTALAQRVDAQVRSPFQRDIIKLFERLTLYHRLENSLEVAGTIAFKSQIDDLLKNIRPSPTPLESGISSEALQSLSFLAETGYFFPIPPVPPNDDPLQWSKMGESILLFITAGNMHGRRVGLKSCLGEPAVILLA